MSLTGTDAERAGLLADHAQTFENRASPTILITGPSPVAVVLRP